MAQVMIFSNQAMETQTKIFLTTAVAQSDILKRPPHAPKLPLRAGGL